MSLRSGSAVVFAESVSIDESRNNFKYCVHPWHLLPLNEIEGICIVFYFAGIHKLYFALINAALHLYAIRVSSSCLMKSIFEF